MTRWMYGDAWERWPIAPGEVWGWPDGSRVAVHNLFAPLPEFMATADLLFVDPPWNLGNINAFYTKAGRTDYLDDFQAFVDVLFRRVAEISPPTVYIEIGNQGVDNFYRRLQALYPLCARWPVTYYRKHPTWIIRGSRRAPAPLDLTGIDEAKCIQQIAQAETYMVLGDFCMGRGLVGLAAHAAGKPFVGTELNQRRLACLLDQLARRGAAPTRIFPETL